jgi:hypothetical protein
LLESLITSKTRIKLLLKFFLNPGTTAYLREIASEFGESTNSIRVELNRLTEAKILRSRSSGRTIEYRANAQNSFFGDIETLVRKYVGLDQLVVNVVQKLGDINAAYVIGDYAKGIDSGLIDLVLIGIVDEDQLKYFTHKTEQLINRKIRVLILNSGELVPLAERLDLENSLLLWEQKD